MSNHASALAEFPMKLRSQAMDLHLVEDGLVGGALLHGRSDLVEVLSTRQLCVPMGIQEAEVAVQLAPVVACQLCAYAIECDIQGPPVSLHHRTERDLVQQDRLFLCTPCQVGGPPGTHFYLQIWEKFSGRC